MVLVPLALALGMVGGIFIGRYVTVSNLSPAESKLHDILSIVGEEYVDKVNVDSLLEKSLPSILASLDPHSSYIPASDLQAVNDDLQGSFSGVGVSFQIIADSVNVIEVVPGGPAEKVGILPGDRIIAAGDKKLTGPEVTSQDVFDNLRGKKGTSVKLKVVRNTSAKPLEFDIVRDDIPQNSVDCSYIIADGVGYVRVSKFARTTYEEFKSALETLSDMGVVNLWWICAATPAVSWIRPSTWQMNSFPRVGL